jgi:predicted RNase H-like HicB family nuclease
VQYQVLIEFDPETKSYSATVPGLAVFVSADTEKEALKLVKESLQLYLEETKGRRRLPHADRPAKAKLVTVEI